MTLLREELGPSLPKDWKNGVAS
jgi:hypothetical protein